MKKENKKMKLKDSDFDDDIKNIKTMVNFLLNHYEKNYRKFFIDKFSFCS